MSNSRHFELQRKVGDGAFGEVYEGREVETGKKVAVKLTKFGALREKTPVPKALLRELWALQLFSIEKSPYLTRYLTHYAHQSHLAIVLAFRDVDVQKLCADFNGLGLCGARSVSRMTLAALAHIHHYGIMHRDLKPSNLLINSELGLVELADFGQCRPIVNEEKSATHPTFTQHNSNFTSSHEIEVHPDLEERRNDMTHQVSTRWYRAPELLFGARHYSQAIDLWGCGLVLAEVIANSPLFPGTSDLDQLIRIFKLRGSPTFERWPSAVNLPDFNKIQFSDTPPAPLQSHQALTRASPHAIQLLDALLQLEPSRRPSAISAFSFSFFQLSPPASDSLVIKLLLERQKSRLQKQTIISAHTKNTKETSHVPATASSEKSPGLS